jgi:TolB protein
MACIIVLVKRTIVILSLAVALVLAGIGMVFWQGAPRLEATFPQDGNDGLPAGTSLRLEFSQAMQPDSVGERLSIQPTREGKFTREGTALVFTPDQYWKAGEVVQVRLEKGARAAGFLHFATRQVYAWSFTIREPLLVYLFPSRGPANLHVLDPRTGKDSPLAEMAGGIQDFSLNASATVIYFTLVKPGGSDIYRLDFGSYWMGMASEPKGQEAARPAPELVFSCPRALCRAATASPRDETLAYERTPNQEAGQPSLPQVWLLSLREDAGSALIPSEPVLAGDPLHQTLQPAWSEGGLLAFYDTTAAAYVLLDPLSGQKTLFPNQTGQATDWHPDGERFVAAEIFFTNEGASGEPAGLEAGAYSHLILFNRIDGSLQDLTPGEDIEDTFPAFSPDGATLALGRKYLDAQRWTLGRQLYLMRLGGGEARPLTNDPDYNHFDFAWSPTGEQLVYVRFNQASPTEPPEIWIVDPLTGVAERLATGGYAPQWMP